MSIFSKNKTKDEAKQQQSVEQSHAGHNHDAETRVISVPQVNDATAYGAIVGPHVTEKASFMGALNKYVFKVSSTTNKIEIKKAVEKLYKVDVVQINIQNMPSKTKQIGRYQGIKSGFKKAIVTVKDGQKIEIV